MTRQLFQKGKIYMVKQLVYISIYFQTHLNKFYIITIKCLLDILNFFLISYILQNRKYRIERGSLYKIFYWTSARGEQFRAELSLYHAALFHNDAALNRISTVWKIVRDAQSQKENALGTMLQSSTSLGTFFSCISVFLCYILLR